MSKFQGRSAELFEELVQALVEEGRETGELEIDSMRFAQMELLGHGLGKELSRRVQQALADCQTQQMAQSFACPQCGRECPTQTKPKRLTSLDGEVEVQEVRCFCKTCRKAFFPSA